MIEKFLEQIRTGAGSKQHYLALFAALAFPDIAGAIDSDDGCANRTNYVDWFNTYVAPKYNAWNVQYLTGDDCYQYRCAMLHQGKVHHPKSRYSRTIFMEAKQKNIAYCGAFTVDSGCTLCVDIQIFCNHIVDAGYEWLEQVDTTDRFQAHSAEFARFNTLAFE